MRGQVKVYQKKIVAKKRRRALFASLYSILFFGLVASGLSYLSHLKAFQIDEVIVSGNNRLPEAEIEKVVREKSAGNYFGLFSKENSLLYPKDDVAAALLSLPLVKEARTVRDGLRGVAVSVAERKGIAEWCGEAECFSIDENGFVFAPVQGATDSVLTYRGLLEGDPVGKQFLAPADFKKIHFFLNQLAGLSIDPREAAIDEFGYMTVSLGDGGKVIVYTKDDLSVVLGNIATVISDKSVAPSFSEFLSNLDYLKIDSGNKAVYKPKEPEEK
jgi:hypothetical protein